MIGSMKLQPDNRSRSSLGIRSSSDDDVRSRQEFARRFAEGIEKLMKGDRREEDQRTCRKNVGGYLIIREIRATTSTFDE
ncbi:hypothetical protein B296_00056394 [Ensete ventricosum]|uniref:Uncharacterized protein n=1 Tax=Ensete ventricosum TaxID=4639 RepID=A0A426XPR5_ENSVE|nr:hypothetical protein B296_00056394 [Ensete ventricosum]